jgi:hypothetical protein
MTSKDDMKATLEAQAVQIKKDIADTQERTKLITEYKDIVQKSPVAGAPFMHEGTFSDELFNTEVETLGGMVTAAIAGIVLQRRFPDRTSTRWNIQPHRQGPIHRKRKIWRHSLNCRGSNYDRRHKQHCWNVRASWTRTNGDPK